MPKGQKHDEQDKRDAVARFKGLGGTPNAAKETAAELGVSPKTVQKWAKSSKPKRKVKRAVKAVKGTSEESAFDSLFNDYIESRNAAQEAFKQAEEAKKRLEALKKRLEAFVKELK